jgi:hypothetical protein
MGRFIRWDRAGAIVSESFDYIKSPHILVQFFWNYARLPSDRRGYDSTVSAAMGTVWDLCSTLPGTDDLPPLILEIPS